MYYHHVKLKAGDWSHFYIVQENHNFFCSRWMDGLTLPIMHSHFDSFSKSNTVQLLSAIFKLQPNNWQSGQALLSFFLFSFGGGGSTDLHWSSTWLYTSGQHEQPSSEECALPRIHAPVHAHIQRLATKHTFKKQTHTSWQAASASQESSCKVYVTS